MWWDSAMAGGTKPLLRTRKPESYKDGARKRGGIGVKRHAGPQRASKTPSSGVKGAQLQKRGSP
jgi:hypothetical protein